MEFSPSVYEHAAKVIDKTPWEVSRSADLLSRGNVKAFNLYRHRPVVVGIDIYNLEAEAYGATVTKPYGIGVPAISKPPYRSAKEVLKLPLFNPEEDGRIPMVIEAAKRVAEQCPEADVRIPLGGPFSIAVNLVGFENLLNEILTDPDLVAGALHHLVIGQVKFCREIVDQGLDIAFFESAAAPPLLSPRQFRDIEFAPLKQIMEKTSAVVGHPVPCVMGGDTLGILDAILETGTGYVCCPAATDQKLFMEKMRAHPEVMVRINMDPRAITAGDFEAVSKEVDRVIALAGDRERVCIGTGCLPYETNPEAVIRTRGLILSMSR